MRKNRLLRHPSSHDQGVTLWVVRHADVDQDPSAYQHIQEPLQMLLQADTGLCNLPYHGAQGYKHERRFVAPCLKPALFQGPLSFKGCAGSCLVNRAENLALLTLVLKQHLFVHFHVVCKQEVGHDGEEPVLGGKITDRDEVRLFRLWHLGNRIACSFQEGCEHLVPKVLEAFFIDHDIDNRWSEAHIRNTVLLAEDPYPAENVAKIINDKVHIRL